MKHFDLWWIACGAFIAVAAYFGLTGLPKEWLTPAGLVGENGSLGILLGFGTTAGAAIAAINAIAALRQADRSELSNRFQKGVELLNSTSRVSGAAGITLIEAVADEDPETFATVSISVLIEYPSDSQRDDWKEVVAHLKDGDQRTAHWPITSPAVFQALSVVQGLRDRHLDEEFELRVNGILFATFDFPDMTFSHMAILAAVVVGCEFSGGLFDNFRLRALAGPQVVFKGVTFRKCTFDISRDADYWKPLAPDAGWVVFDDLCEFDDDSLINGMTMESWRSATKEAS